MSSVRKPILSIRNANLLVALAPLLLFAASIYLFEAARRWLGIDLSPPVLLLILPLYFVILVLARCPVCRGLPWTSDGSLLGVRRFNLRPRTCGRCGADFEKLTFWTRVPRDDLLGHMAFRRQNGLGSHDFSE